MSTSPAAGRPSATAIEHIRPPIERPPSATDVGGTPACPASAAASSTTVAMSLAGRSGARRPSRRYGKSTRATGRGRTACSMATSV